MRLWRLGGPTCSTPSRFSSGAGSSPSRPRPFTASGAAAEDPVAVRRLFEVKGRPPEHPVIVHVAGTEGLDRYAAERPRYGPAPDRGVLARTADRHRRAQRPGPGRGHRRSCRRSACGPRPIRSRRPCSRHSGPASRRRPPTGSAGSARRPQTPYAPSSDRTSTSSSTVDRARSVSSRRSSTAPARSRSCFASAAFPAELLADTLGHPIEVSTAIGGAPGTLRTHYAPTARVVVVDSTDAVTMRWRPRPAPALGRRARARRDRVRGRGAAVGMGNADEYAQRLYSTLRALDDDGIEVVIAAARGCPACGAASPTGSRTSVDRARLALVVRREAQPPTASLPTSSSSSATAPTRWAAWSSGSAASRCTRCAVRSSRTRWSAARPSAVVVMSAARASAGSDFRSTRPRSTIAATIRVSVGGATASRAARSASRTGSRASTEVRHDSCDGVRPLIERWRSTRASRATASRRRAACSSSSLSSASGGTAGGYDPDASPRCARSWRAAPGCPQQLPTGRHVPAAGRQPWCPHQLPTGRHRPGVGCRRHGRGRCRRRRDDRRPGVRRRRGRHAVRMVVPGVPAVLPRAGMGRTRRRRDRRRGAGNARRPLRQRLENRFKI